MIIIMDNSDQDFICLMGLWYNLNKARIEKSHHSSLTGNLSEGEKKSEWSAVRLIWPGISRAQSALASLRKLIVSWGGKVQKRPASSFSLTNPWLLSLYSSNPHSSQSGTFPINLSSLSPRPLHPSLYQSLAEELCYYLTSQKGQIKMCCSPHSLSRSV